MAGGWPVGVAGVGKSSRQPRGIVPAGFRRSSTELASAAAADRFVIEAALPPGPKHSAAFAKACSEGPVVVIDGYPGRAASSVLETFARSREGSYRVVLRFGTPAFTPYETWTGIPAAALGYDLENAQTIREFRRAFAGWLGNSRDALRDCGRSAPAGVGDPQLAPDSNRVLAFANRRASLAVDTRFGQAPRMRSAAGLAARACSNSIWFRHTAQCRRSQLAECGRPDRLRDGRDSRTAHAPWSRKLQRCRSHVMTILRLRL